jgi:sugar lactone lactonase YvrE
VTDDGQIWLSDSVNHRVVSVNQQGKFLSSIGEGTVASGPYGFDTPGGLAVDALGNLWVADTGNHELKKYSPMGVFLTTVGHDELARPEAVAVDDAGNVFVSDDELLAVFAFGPDGAFLGSFGRGDAGRPESAPRLQAPGGIKVRLGHVYVMDRLSGLFVFDVGATGAP